jgi:Flp pilus assembly pilin Flp
MARFLESLHNFVIREEGATRFECALLFTLIVTICWASSSLGAGGNVLFTSVSGSP